VQTHPKLSLRLSRELDINDQEITTSMVLTLDSIALTISFIPLSTYINALGEIERRFLTPFGIVDVVCRASKHDRRPQSQFEQERLEDTDTRVVLGQTSGEFQTAFQRLWWETTQRFLAENIAGNNEGVRIHQEHQ
jgi:hypothetical protein